MVYLVQYLETTDEIANSLFLALTEACTLFKIINILKARQNIILYTNSLASNLGRPNGPEEVRIQLELDRRNRLVNKIRYISNSTL